MKNYCSVSNDGNVFKKVDPSEVNKSDDEIMRKKKENQRGGGILSC